MSRQNRRGKARGKDWSNAAGWQQDAAMALAPPGVPATMPTMRDRHAEGRIMGLDIGGKRIGVAISDETRIIATPVRFVERGAGDRRAFAELIERYTVGRLVVGLPTGMSGREGPQSADVRAYADQLAMDLDLPMDYWDERLSTAIAERTLIAGGSSRADRRTRVDAVAAAVILQGYLDHERYQRR